jgi:UDP-GlcNAc:undecaprenyl-phosphate GlcNAc-1-phosphate transferase
MEADLAALPIGATLAFALVIVLMPMARHAWDRVGHRDRESSLRKVHGAEIPRVGGAVVLAVTAAVVGFGLAGKTDLSRTHRILSPSPLSGVLAGALLVGLVGLLDDIRGVRARTKLAIQGLAAALAIALGVEWQPAVALLDRNLVSTAMTWIFFVVATNAVNLIDGLDGLAGGVVALGLGVAVAASLAGTCDLSVGWTAAVALGAVAGFLVWNRHPARVFLGDAGAYFLGFLLAGLVMFVDSTRPRKPIVGLSVAVLVIALPLLDMALAIFRRAARGQPLLAGDADHVHHRLLARGLGHWQAVATLWAVQGGFSAMALLTVLGVGGAWTLAGALVVSAVVPVVLGYHRLLLPPPGTPGSPGWFDRRQRIAKLVAATEELARGGGGADAARRVAPLLEPILVEMGAVAHEVRVSGEVVAARGENAASKAWIVLQVDEHSELRIALGGSFVSALHPEQQMLLERMVAALAGRPLERRGADEARPQSK